MAQATLACTVIAKSRGHRLRWISTLPSATLKQPPVTSCQAAPNISNHGDNERFPLSPWMRWVCHKWFDSPMLESPCKLKNSSPYWGRRNIVSISETRCPTMSLMKFKRLLFMAVVSICLLSACLPTWRAVRFDFLYTKPKQITIQPPSIPVELSIKIDRGLHLSLDTVRVFVEAKYLEPPQHISFEPSSLKIIVGDYEFPRLGPENTITARLGKAKQRLSPDPKSTDHFSFAGRHAPFTGERRQLCLVLNGFIRYHEQPIFLDTLALTIH